MILLPRYCMDTAELTCQYLRMGLTAGMQRFCEKKTVLAPQEALPEADDAAVDRHGTGPPPGAHRPGEFLTPRASTAESDTAVVSIVWQTPMPEQPEMLNQMRRTEACWRS